ncbi:MAG: hypothetical protein CL885_02760 [Dehalococcoidia bacterium]|nr:hypothetical protein [Dehalococcoidia bacterium]|tara:strand:+ start:235 stop:927 length:693 start_codon:yes stop_codon:yes gene_type:complete
MELNFSKNINNSTELQQIIAGQKSRQEINDLLDSDFAYIERGGQKIEGKTVPRSLRHLPISNAAEVEQSIEQFENYPLPAQAKEEASQRLAEAAKKHNVEIKADWEKTDTKELKKDTKKEKEKHEKDAVKDDKSKIKNLKKGKPSEKKSVEEHDLKKDEEMDKEDETKYSKAEEASAMKMEEDDAMMKKMYSRMDEIKKARKDMDKEYAMIEKKLGAMMKKVKASSSEND